MCCKDICVIDKKHPLRYEWSSITRGPVYFRAVAPVAAPSSARTAENSGGTAGGLLFLRPLNRRRPRISAETAIAPADNVLQTAKTARRLTRDERGIARIGAGTARPDGIDADRSRVSLAIGRACGAPCSPSGSRRRHCRSSPTSACAGSRARNRQRRGPWRRRR